FRGVNPLTVGLELDLVVCVQMLQNDFCAWDYGSGGISDGASYFAVLNLCRRASREDEVNEANAESLGNRAEVPHDSLSPLVASVLECRDRRGNLRPTARAGCESKRPGTISIGRGGIRKYIPTDTTGVRE